MASFDCVDVGSILKDFTIKVIEIVSKSKTSITVLGADETGCINLICKGTHLHCSKY